MKDSPRPTAKLRTGFMDTSMWKSAQQSCGVDPRTHPPVGMTFVVFPPAPFQPVFDNQSFAAARTRAFSWCSWVFKN